MTKFKAKYNEEPDDFNAVAYDTIILLAEVIDKYGDDRKAIRDGLAEIKDVPSVIYGKATFRCADAAGRRRARRLSRRQERPVRSVGRQEADRELNAVFCPVAATEGGQAPPSAAVSFGVEDAAA